MSVIVGRTEIMLIGIAGIVRVTMSMGIAVVIIGVAKIMDWIAVLTWVTVPTGITILIRIAIISRITNPLKFFPEFKVLIHINFRLFPFRPFIRHALFLLLLH
ncbi:MAG: hypothetical protein ABFC84_15925 [Veillonellales bacterium]